MDTFRKTPLISSLFAAALSMGTSQPSAQDMNPVVGTWAVVAVHSVAADGSKNPGYGENPRGQLVLAPNGRYHQTVMRASLPKFASNSRTAGTPEEYAAVMKGSNTHFGRYSVDTDKKTITFHIEAATFPNWDGMTQVRPYILEGDQLTYHVPQASGGGRGEVILKRIP